LEFVKGFFKKSLKFFQVFFRGAPPTEMIGGIAAIQLVFPLQSLFNQLLADIFRGIIPDHLQEVA
jgi:hypothetical protein